MRNLEPRAEKCILIVDDDKVGSAALASRLERRGFRTITVNDSRKVMNTLKGNDVHIVLLDVVMPHLDGLAVLKEVRKKFPIELLPVLMLTALDDSTDILHAFEAGASDYVRKAEAIDAVISRIRGQLSMNELRLLELDSREAQALSSLVVKYNYQISKPLTVARSRLQSLVKGLVEIDQKKLQLVYESLDEIGSILQKIKKVSEKNPAVIDSRGVLFSKLTDEE